MPNAYNPIDEYLAYPIDLPANGEKLSEDNLNSVSEDTYNRIVHLKALVTSIQSSLSGLVVVDEGLQTQITDVLEQIATINEQLTTLGTQLGGVTYEDPHYMIVGDSHRVALQKLDDQIYSIVATLDGIIPGLTTTANNITSIAGKVSTNALDNNMGFDFTGLTYLVQGDKTDEAFIKLDPAITTNRRINHYNFEQIFLNWAEVNSITDSFYEDLIDSSKIYAASSTPDAYDNVRQQFGVATTWYYYNTSKVVTAGRNRIKLRLSKSTSGIITASVTLTGSYSGPFISIPSTDTWVDISATTGTGMILKLTGTSNARLYNLMVLLDTV